MEVLRKVSTSIEWKLDSREMFTTYRELAVISYNIFPAFAITLDLQRLKISHAKSFLGQEVQL